jgi:hypothetical protein
VQFDEPPRERGLLFGKSGDRLGRAGAALGRGARRLAGDARVHTAVALAAIIAVGAAVRIWALGGLSFALGSDDSRYVAVAQNLAAGNLPAGDGEWRLVATVDLAQAELDGAPTLRLEQLGPAIDQ